MVHVFPDVARHSSRLCPIPEEPEVPQVSAKAASERDNYIKSRANSIPKTNERGFHVEDVLEASSTDGRWEKSGTEEADRKKQLSRVYRKIDVRLLALYCAISIILRISERNISNAAILNLEEGTGIRKQLGNLSNSQWAWVLSIAYYPYIIFDTFAVLLLKKFGPQKWMSRIMISWGIVAMCQAATTSYAGIMVCRFILGMAESGYMPSILFHMTLWYPTDQTCFRISILAACTISSGAFSGLLAYGISFLNNYGALAGWQYMFLLEGAPALLIGLGIYYILPGYPEDVRFLTEAERELVKSNLAESQPTGDGKTWNTAEAIKVLKDPLTYFFCLIWLGQTIGGMGVLIVLPQVIYDLGLKGTAVTQLLTIPSSVLTCICLLLCGWAVQKKRFGPWLTAFILELIVLGCYIALLVVEAPWARYAVVTITAGPAISVLTILWPERTKTARGNTATGLSIGLTASCAHFMGIVGPHIYSKQFGPRYIVSYSVSIGILVAVMILMPITWAYISFWESKDEGTSRRSHISQWIAAVRAGIFES